MNAQHHRGEETDEPRIVVDIQYGLTCQESGPDIAQPVILILANAGGYLHQARTFEAMAHRKGGPPEPWADPDDHAHISMYDKPFDRELSGNLEFRLGVLNSQNLAAVTERYGLASESSHHGCMTRWFRSMVESAESEIARSAGSESID